MEERRESACIEIDGVAGIPAIDANAKLLDSLLEQKQQLEQLNAWFDVALNNMVRGLSMFDAQNRLVVCNDYYRQIYGLPEELTRSGTPLADILEYYLQRDRPGGSGGERMAIESWLETHVRKLAEGQTYCSVQHMRDGRKLLVTYKPLAGGGWVDTQEDITEKRRTEERIEWLARHDALTGVANRFHFRETFENALKEVNTGSALALHWIDLDGFKDVNDRLGHPIGDALLKAVAQRLRASVRRCDFIARLGGDEFAIVQSSARCSEQCSRLARRVLRNIGKPYHIFGHEIRISASIGIVCAPENGDCADELLSYADVALYEVKTAGRHGFKLFKGGHKSEHNRSGGLEVDIHAAVSRNQLELHYQPVVNLNSRDVTSCEALLRWRHPRFGLVAPKDFLPLAERTGAIIDIGRWVLEQACRDARQWGHNTMVTVNLSLLQVESAGLHDAVVRALSVVDLDPVRLKLEIDETVLDHNEEELGKILERLHRLGVGLTLDNFGRSSASLNNLRSYPFSSVKVDRGLVKDLHQHGESAAIIMAVALAARALGIETIAEGVETSEELNAVALAGCEKVQGYYFSRPVPLSELQSVVSTRSLRFAA